MLCIFNVELTSAKAVWCGSSISSVLHVPTLHRYPFGRRSNLLMVKTKLNPL